MLIDTHCHLDFPDYENDLDGVLTRAREAGVERMISIGTDLSSSRAAIRLAETYPDVYATVGVHPCNVESSWDASTVDQLSELSRHPKVVAIGEAGLDYHHLPAREDFSSDEAYEEAIKSIKANQKQAFIAQCQLADREGHNLVIHQRNSWDDCLEILKPFQGRFRTVFHCFSESTDRALHLIESGHLVSFTGLITFKKLDDLRATAAALPPDSFMLETDAPYLAPVPHRGKRCEPAMVADTARVVAEARGMSLAGLLKSTGKTAVSFFRFS